MPLAALLFAILLSPPESNIVVTGRQVPPFVSPMGEPFRGRIGGKDAFVAWFRQADRNQDDSLTLDEFQADAYACAQADGRDLAQALLKLHEDNAATLTPDPVYVRFYYSHPPASERLAALPAVVQAAT